MTSFTETFSFSYNKRKNTELFKDLETTVGISKIQNFIPIYNMFFSLNRKNYNDINLNHKYHLCSINDKKNENKFVGKIENKNGKMKKNLFLKYSPLLDPIKYMIGKYDISQNLFELPHLNKKNSHKKVKNNNNSAYVDGFFSYLSSQLLHEKRFCHGIDFYGSFIGLKQNFYYNIFDDFDYLNNSSFFHQNMDKLFKIENNRGDIFSGNSRNRRKKIKITDEKPNIECEEMPNDLFGDIFKTPNKEKSNDLKILLSFKDTSKNEIPSDNKKLSKTQDSSSTCSSRSSYTDDSSEFSDEEDDEESSQESSESEGENEVLNAIIEEFPVNIICLEGLEDTLDSLLFGGKILTIPEWKSIIFQILIMLITYQKVFSFTHNDLHTNNIMFEKTEKPWLYYCFNGTYYKVPTFGKIFKIIDFGRAIYNFRDQVVCSDSFQSKGDAATQYNFGPCLNKKKPILEPNFSFDLTRLACSLYDYFVPYSDEEHKVTHKIGKLIIKWCKDDRGKNILYKHNGDERYPDFKLYKMIARTVHNHLPVEEIKNPMFDEFKVTKKSLKKKRIFNLDILQKYYTK